MKTTLLDMVLKRTELEFKQRELTIKWRELQSDVKSIAQKISELNKNIGLAALEVSKNPKSEDYSKLHKVK